MVKLKHPKAKGSNFERKVAKMLSEWSEFEFHRTPMSGALHWANDKRIVSDIVPPQELVDKGWPFSIECKCCQYDWDFSQILEGTSTFWKHWKQCWDDAQREGMEPLLVFTKNYRDTYITLLFRTYSKFAKSGLHGLNVIQIQYEGYKLILLKFQAFLEHITLQEVLSKAKV